MKIAKLQDQNTLVIFCAPAEKSDYLQTLGYKLVGFTDLARLEERAQKMLVEFRPTSNFDFIKMNWLPIFTTAVMRSKFNKIEKDTAKLFEHELNRAEFWAPGKINNKGYFNALLNSK